jgi:predicted nucleic acid-binding protein
MLEVILRTAPGIRALDFVLSEEESLHAPHLLDLEVVQVLRRYIRAGIIDEQRATEALDDFSSFPIQRYPHDLFRNRIWELRENLTAYDAVYVALAEALGATLLTCDRSLAASAGQRADIVLP